MHRSVGEVDSILAMCGSLVESSREREKEKIKELGGEKESSNINKNILNIFYSLVRRQKVHIFLIADEDHLCAFSWMGFNVRFCVYA